MQQCQAVEPRSTALPPSPPASGRASHRGGRAARKQKTSSPLSLQGWETALISPAISSPPCCTSATRRGHATHLFLLSFFLTSFPFAGICTLWDISARTSPESPSPRVFRAKESTGRRSGRAAQRGRGLWGRTQPRPGAGRSRRPPHAAARLALPSRGTRRGRALPRLPGNPARGKAAGPRPARPSWAAPRGARWLPSGRWSGTGGDVRRCNTRRGGERGPRQQHRQTSAPGAMQAALRSGEQRRFPATLTPLRLQEGTRSRCPGSWGYKGPQEQAGKAGAVPRPERLSASVPAAPAKLGRATEKSWEGGTNTSPPPNTPPSPLNLIKSPPAN